MFYRYWGVVLPLLGRFFTVAGAFFTVVLGIPKRCQHPFAAPTGRATTPSLHLVTAAFHRRRARTPWNHIVPTTRSEAIAAGSLAVVQPSDHQSKRRGWQRRHRRVTSHHVATGKAPLRKPISLSKPTGQPLGSSQNSQFLCARPWQVFSAGCLFRSSPHN